MRLRLLSKSDVQKIKSTERQRDIEEGLKLATRVDNLREVAAAEELSLEQFRRKTTEIIGEEIKELDDKKQQLLSEIEVLERRSSEAMLPYEDMQRQTPLVREVVDDLHSVFDSRKTELDSIETNLRERMAKCKTEEKSIAYAQADVKRRLTEAAIIEENANLQREQAREVSSYILEQRTRQDAHYATLETFWRQKNESLESREKIISKLDKDLTNRERALKDKYETFIRATTKYVGHNTKRSTSEG